MKDIDWSKLGFGYMDTNCHIRYTWKDGAWDKGELVADPHFPIHIAAAALHYGQECFEGLKVFRTADGKVQAFRPDENGRRMSRTARRLCMPDPGPIFLEALDRVVKANLEFVPPYGTGGSLYVRPLLFGSGPQIGVAPATEYTFLVMVMPVGAYYKGGIKPVRAVILDDYDRAAPQGTGDIKCGGNYAASLFAHESAKHAGWPVELYLDSKTHTYVEEFATSNFLGIRRNDDGSRTYVTPDSHSVLPSVTNMTLREIAADLGMKVEVRPVPYAELPFFSEIAACGTAVVVTPVYEITRGSEVIRIGDPDKPGETLQTFFDTVQGIQYGRLPDTHGWNHVIA